MKLYGMLACTAFSGALVFGGLNVAVAHHGNFEDHTTTKTKTKAQAERIERQITAELNQKSLMLAQPAPQTPMMAPPAMMMPAPQGAPPAGQAELRSAPQAEIAAVEEEDDVN